MTAAGAELLTTTAGGPADRGGRRQGREGRQGSGGGGGGGGVGRRALRVQGKALAMVTCLCVRESPCVGVCASVSTPPSPK